MASNRIPRGYEAQVAFREVSAGIRPAEELYPAKYLPTVKHDRYLDDYMVVEGGTIISIDPSGSYSQFGVVPCNGGTPRIIEYTAADVGIILDIDDPANYVTAAGTAATNLASNKPIGVAMYNYYNPNVVDIYNNYTSGTQDKVAIVTDYYIEIPYIPAINDAGGALAPGDKVMSDRWGRFIKWDGTDASQIVGTLWVIDNILVKDNLDKVQTIPGLGLAGSGTNGVAQNLNVAGCVGALRINLNL